MKVIRAGGWVGPGALNFVSVFLFSDTLGRRRRPPQRPAVEMRLPHRIMTNQARGGSSRGRPVFSS